MHAFGASMQDEAATVTVNTPATVEAVKMGAAIFKAGMTDEVFGWDAASNNRLLASGRGSLIVNPISALRAAEQQDPDLAADIALAPLPIGPAGDVPRSERIVHCYVIWKFAKHQELARRFLVDYAVAYREAFVRSGLYNMPSFPGAVPDLAEVVAKDPQGKPPDKYALLAGATSWMTNIGAPGSLNAAVDEAFSRFILPRMFAAAARGEKTAEQAVADAEAEIKPIFEKWRERGKI
jgi:multiple sugar transport system substrate-binding protein